MTPKIFIDALGIDCPGGGRTAIRSLLKAMFELDHETQFVLCLSRAESDLVYPNVEQRVLERHGRFAIRLYLQTNLPRWVRQEKIDLVHFTKNLGVFGLGCPYVVTIHDLTTLVLANQHHPLDVLYWLSVEPLTLRGAARIVAVSQDCAHDVQRFYGIPADQVTVVYWAAHPRFTPTVSPALQQSLRERYHLPEQYILFIGILAKKKNLVTLLHSIAELRRRGVQTPPLVVVGRQYPQSNDTTSALLARELALEGQVHFVGCVPDEDLPAFYAGAAVYVLPSLHEGFGIPCLEAMACGTPVVATHGGALPEIIGPAGVVVENPCDVQGLATAIERVLFDSTLRAQLIQSGFQRAAEFSWVRSARKMLEIYQEVLRGRDSG